MRAVSDTSPLYNLAAIGRLHLLAQQFEQVLVPPAVRSELEPIWSTSVGEALARTFELPSFCILEPKNVHLVRSFRLELDLGESETLALALEQEVRCVLLDEAAGRRVAREMKLVPVGVLGILLRGKREGQVESLRECLTALREEVGFYLRRELVTKLLAEAGEE